MSNIVLPSETNTAALLNLFMYLDYTDTLPGQSISSILNDIEKNWDMDKVSEANKNQFDILKRAAAENAAFGNMKIGLQRHTDADGGGIDAAVFTGENGEAYVVYRGTGDGKWIDNGRGMVAERTTSQIDATKFLDEAAAHYGWNEDTNLIVTGHSKGGNNAQSATLGADAGEYVDQCISFDGQGMSEAGRDYYQERLGETYEERRRKLYSVNGKNDPVNELGYKVIPDGQTAYIETNTDEDHFVSTHALEYFYYQGTNEKGEPIYGTQINDQTEQGSIGRYASKLSDYLMSLPEEEREACSVAIMQLIEFGDKYKTGYDGDHADIEDWEAFLEVGLPVIVFSLIGTEEGWEAMSDILGAFLESYYEKYGAVITAATIAAIVAIVPIVMPKLVKDLLLFLGGFYLAVDLLAKLKRLSECLYDFLQDCIQAIKAFAEEARNWVREHIYGATVFTDAQFQVSTGELLWSAEQLRRVQRRFADAKGEIESVKNTLPYFSAGGSIMKAKLTVLMWQIYGLGAKAGQMATLADQAGQKYQRYESGIVAHVTG